MTTRRGFLKSILALGIAPAIVKAENLMRIYVPKPDIFTFGTGDFTVQGWLRPTTEQWTHIAMVRKYGEVSHYLDGTLIDYEVLKNRKWDLLQDDKSILEANLDGNKLKLINPKFEGYVSDLNLYSIAVVPNKLVPPPELAGFSFIS